MSFLNNLLGNIRQQVGGIRTTPGYNPNAPIPNNTQQPLQGTVIPPVPPVQESAAYDASQGVFTNDPANDLYYDDPAQVNQPVATMPADFKLEPGDEGTIGGGAPTQASTQPSTLSNIIGSINELTNRPGFYDALIELGRPGEATDTPTDPRDAAFNRLSRINKVLKDAKEGTLDKNVIKDIDNIQKNDFDGWIQAEAKVRRENPDITSRKELEKKTLEQYKETRRKDADETHQRKVKKWGDNYIKSKYGQNYKNKVNADFALVPQLQKRTQNFYQLIKEASSVNFGVKGNLADFANRWFPGEGFADRAELNRRIKKMAQEILNTQSGTKTDFDFQVSQEQVASLDFGKPIALRLAKEMLMDSYVFGAEIDDRNTAIEDEVRWTSKYAKNAFARGESEYKKYIGAKTLKPGSAQAATTSSNSDDWDNN